jgi:hypothetical protein
MQQDIPKIIWMVWFQGLETAPPVVKACYASWQHINPTWEVRLLDADTLRTMLPDAVQYIESKHIPAQALSDIIRILLLEKYGGVWADASVFCAKPLNEWISTVTPHGFFAFSKPRKDKLISSWFLIASVGNPIITSWSNLTQTFWKRGVILHQRYKKIYHKFDHAMYLIGLSSIMKKTMHLLKYVGVFPYFWFHFLFDELYKKDTSIRNKWKSTPHISADGPHSLLFYGLDKLPDEHILSQIQRKNIPVYKLSWRSEIIPNSVLSTLINETEHTYGYTTAL